MDLYIVRHDVSLISVDLKRVQQTSSLIVFVRMRHTSHVMSYIIFSVMRMCDKRLYLIFKFIHVFVFVVIIQPTVLLT